MKKAKSIALDPAMEQKILQTVNGMPPLIWLDGLTPEQAEHWNRVKRIFSHLHHELEAYFSGEAMVWEDLPKIERSFFPLLRDYYLAFYSLTRDGWRGIQSEAQSLGVDLNADLGVDSPGECLLHVLKRSCEVFFVSCLTPYEEWSMRRIYDTYRLKNQMKPLLERPTESWSKKERSKYNRYISQAKGPANREQKLLIFCLIACEKTAKRDTNLRRKVKEFWDIHARLQRLLASLLHPSKGRKSFAWKEGDLLTTAEGGIYR